jgi:hypothetical protein
MQPRGSKARDTWATLSPPAILAKLKSLPSGLPDAEDFPPISWRLTVSVGLDALLPAPTTLALFLIRAIQERPCIDFDEPPRWLRPTTKVTNLLLRSKVLDKV